MNSRPVSSMAATSADLLVESTNSLMRTIGMTQRTFATAEEVRENASSLFVAVFESLFSTRLAGVRRKPDTLEAYAENAQHVIDALRSILPLKIRIPGSVTGEAVAQGKASAIAALVALFRDVSAVVKPKHPGSSSTHGFSTEDGTAMARLRTQLKAVSPPPQPRSPRAVRPPPIPGSPSSALRSLDLNAGAQGGHADEDKSAAVRAAEEEAGKREAMSRAAMAKQQQGVMRRMQQRNEEELAHIKTMMDAAVKSREAATRVFETSAIRSATTRAKSAKHERKVLVLRTRRVVEDMTRHTLSLRIARSSTQAAAASSLLKAVAAQQRLAAAEQLRAAAEESAADLLTGAGRVAWMQHAAKALNEVGLEETAKQVAQRQAAIHSQRDALQRALSDMRADEQALLSSMKAEQAHAEQVWLAHQVEPMDMGGPLGGGASRDAGLGMPDGHAIATGALHPIDTDASTLRVDTLHRAQRKLGGLEAARSQRMATTERVLTGIAQDTGKLLADSEAMVREARGQVAASGKAMASLAKRG